MRKGDAAKLEVVTYSDRNPVLRPGRSFFLIMRIAISDHQGKSAALRSALARAGHLIVERERPADALLIDVDYPVGHYKPLIQKHRARGAKIYLYSHGANPNLGWDGLWPESGLVDGLFAMTPGQAAVLQLYGYTAPVHVIGWHLCKIKPFTPAARLRFIVFGPWHPHSNGWLAPAAKAVNAAAFKQLLSLAKRHKATLLVRHLGLLADSGLEEDPRAVFIQGRPDQSTNEIDAADLVVSCGTFAYLAVARGRPTYFIGQDLRPFESHAYGHHIEVRSWEKYRDYMRFPYELGQAEIDQVMSAGPLDWKRKFIGVQFNPIQFGQEFSRLTKEAAYATT